MLCHLMNPPSVFISWLGLGETTRGSGHELPGAGFSWHPIPLALMARALRAIEFVALFGGLPAVLAWGFASPPVIPPLLLGGVACFFVLRRDPIFEHRDLWRADAVWVPDVALLGPVCESETAFSA